MTPPLLWFNGEIVPWERGVVHVASEVAVRGANVFEGIRSYWHDESESHFVLDLDAHLERLCESAAILRFPETRPIEELRAAVLELLPRLRYREHLYVRAVIFIESGSYGFRKSDTTVGAYVVAYPVPRAAGCETGIRCCVSGWRRAPDLVAPPRVKAGAFYQALRLPRIEAVERGFDDFIMLNMRETVAEASGAAVFVVRNGHVSTPPLTADILESITRRRVIELLESEHGTRVEERDVNRTELYVADEIFLAGTLTEIQPVVAIDEYVIGGGDPGPIATACRDRYIELCESGDAASTGWLTPTRVLV